MAAAAVPAVPDRAPKMQAPGQMPFDPSQAPVIEGFTPVTLAKNESFKEKFLRKTKENPFVPIGELHKTERHCRQKLHKCTTLCPLLPLGAIISHYIH